jgi:inner membrane protein
MDSLTQITLGSAIGMAVMGRRTAVWKAALWGGVAGTVPDLDAFIDHGDAILNMTRHRAESHSLLLLTLASPLLAWAVSRMDGDVVGLQRRAAASGNRIPSEGSALHGGTPQAPTFFWWWLALWLVLFTHPLLDTMTIYGTQLLQPFTDHPFGVGSIFIIDPLYTVPLIVGVVAALRLKSARGLRWNLAGLALSTLYLAWSFGAQQHATQVARASLADQNISAQGLLVTASPFNTVLWRLLATTPTHYLEGHYSLFDNGTHITWTAHDRGAALIEQHRDEPSVARMAAFTHGFYSLSETDGRLFVTDLRMGQEPAYNFRFDLGSATARANGQHLPTQQSMRPDLGTALPWLWQRLWGHDVPLPRM